MARQIKSSRWMRTSNYGQPTVDLETSTENKEIRIEDNMTLSRLVWWVWDVNLTGKRPRREVKGWVGETELTWIDEYVKGSKILSLKIPSLR